MAQLLAPEGLTPEPLAALLPWLLLQVLQAIGAAASTPATMVQVRTPLERVNLISFTMMCGKTHYLSLSKEAFQAFFYRQPSLVGPVAQGQHLMVPALCPALASC